MGICLHISFFFITFARFFIIHAYVQYIHLTERTDADAFLVGSASSAAWQQLG